jgi:hypothetical protein
VSRLFVSSNEQAAVLWGDSEDVEEVRIRLREIDALRLIR